MGFIDIIVNPPAIAIIVIGIIAVLFITGQGLDVLSEWTGLGDGGGTFTLVGWILVIIFGGLGVICLIKSAS